MYLNKNQSYGGQYNMKYMYILLIVVCMLFPSNILAQPVSNIREMVSENHGTIRDSYFAGANTGIVVHVQDLHCNYDAQISIYNIINELIDKYRLNVVAIEGCVGELDTAPYSKRPNDSIKESVAQYFVKSGQLDGAGFAHMMNHSGFVFWGADDTALYDKNVDAYKKSAAGEMDNIRYYNNMREIIEAIKQKAYPKALKEFDAKIASYKDETLDFSSYVQYLNGLSREKGINLGEHSNFTKLASVVEKESEIDFIEVDNQRSEYVDMLSQRLDKDRLSELLDKSLYFKTGKIAPLAFYTYLKDTAAKENIAEFEKDYAQLSLYIAYIGLYSQIDNTVLFEEIETIEKAIKETLFTDDTQRRIDRMSHNLNIVKDMFGLKLTTNTLQYYRANRKEFTPSYIINFISDTTKKYNVNYKLDPAFRNIAAKLPDIERFYHLAEERDGILVNNTLDVMRKNNAEMAVLVSGGFHTDGITRLLKEQGVSYIVVTPKIETLNPSSLYRSVLLGEKSEFEKFMDKAKEQTKQYKESL
jgi:hypothetical protein